MINIHGLIVIENIFLVLFVPGSPKSAKSQKGIKPKKALSN